VIEGDKDTYGIHYLKFFMALMILFVHELVFSSLVTQQGVDIRNPAFLHFMALVPSSFLAPMTAGGVQAIALRAQLTTGRLKDFDLGPFVKLALGLAFLESVKAALVSMPSVFFGWNVLHFLALALVTVLILARYSVHLVWISGLVCLALTPTLQGLLRTFQVQNTNQVSNLYQPEIVHLAKLILIVPTFTALLIWIWRRSSLERKYKLRLSLGAVVFGNLSLALAMNTPTDIYFVPRILNLPTGLLVGDSLGLHYWPFFPWYSGVALGFCFYYALSQFSRTSTLRILAGALAVLGLGVHFAVLEGSVVKQFDPATIYGVKFFNDNLNLMVFAASSFLLFALLFEKLSRAVFWHRACARFPVLWRVPFVYSKTILWAYLFINALGVLIARPFAPLLMSLGARVVFASIVAASWYWPGEALMKWLARTRITVRLRPVR
jgi:hypothetical protein